MAAKTKYGKCFHNKDLNIRIPYYGGPSLVAHKGELDTDLSVGYHCIAKPMNFDEPHSHPFAELLCFIGGDAENINDFGAEIEFTLGGETHKITEPTVVSIPGNVEHCPIKIIKVAKPIVFLEVSATRIWNPGARNVKKQAADSKPATKKPVVKKMVVVKKPATKDRK
jgi:hypothetical protein